MNDFQPPAFDRIDAVFGAKASTYLTREQMGDDFYSGSIRNEFTNHASSLFYRGGSLLPEGRKWKPGVDRAAAALAIKAWLCSFEPKHEIKIGTVGFALSQWTVEDVEPKEAKPTPPKGEKARKPKGKGRAFK